jgi:hypothetical protein
VLRKWRTPPRYGVELSESALKTMQYGVLLHMPFAFLMFSYTEIFSDNKTIQTLASELRNKEPSILSTIFQSSTRIEQPHAQVYMFAICAIFVVFVTVKIVLFLMELSDISPRRCLQCKNKAKIGTTSASKADPQSAKRQYIEEGSPAFSNNIF